MQPARLTIQPLILRSYDLKPMLPALIIKGRDLIIVAESACKNPPHCIALSQHSPACLGTDANEAAVVEIKTLITVFDGGYTSTDPATEVAY